MNFFPFKTHRIAYRQQGSGADALLLHGFPTSSYDWEKIMPALSQHRRMVAPDFLGFGQSDKPHPHHYSIFEQAEMIAALGESLGLKEVDLVCHDYGDTVGLEVMRMLHQGKLPFNVRSVTLLNGSIYFDLVQLRLIQRVLLWPIAGNIVARLLNRRTFGKQFSALFSPVYPISEAELDAHWELLIQNNGRRVYPSLTRYLDERRQYARTLWEPTLEHLQRPLCVIWGMVDPVAVGAMGKRIQERIPTAEVHLLEKVGHYPQLEVPEVVAEKIIHFWQSPIFSVR